MLLRPEKEPHDTFVAKAGGWCRCKADVDLASYNYYLLIVTELVIELQKQSAEKSACSKMYNSKTKDLEARKSISSLVLYTQL